MDGLFDTYILVSVNPVRGLRRREHLINVLARNWWIGRQM
jgi:hypothetical protein